MIQTEISVLELEVFNRSDIDRVGLDKVLFELIWALDGRGFENPTQSDPTRFCYLKVSSFPLINL